jgi:4-hydroxy-tetrahydrodipicolinate synthase
LAGKRSDAVRGLFTALITPFDRKGNVDLGATSELVRFQVAKGAEGLYPCGSTGLGPLLKTEERKAVARAVVSEAAGRVPVVVQVGSSDTASSVELARDAEKIGASAVASLTPFYYKPGERAVARHFEALAKSVSIPLFAYNIPQFTGNNLTPQAVVSLAKDGTVQGIKDSSRDFLQLLDLLELTPDDFVVMNGIEEYALFALMSGADGLVSGGANPFPEAFSAIVTRHRKGDHAGATKAQTIAQRIKALVKPSPIPSYYALLRRRGVDCGDPRPPLLPLGRAEEGLLAKRLGALGLALDD